MIKLVYATKNYLDQAVNLLATKDRHLTPFYFAELVTPPTTIFSTKLLPMTLRLAEPLENAKSHTPAKIASSKAYL